MKLVKQNLDAFNIAKSEDKKLRDEIFAKKEQVYKLYTELSAAYASALARERSEEAVVHDRAADARESGKWWDRTVLNPTNWFNKKGGFWGETTDNADVAKCLRKNFPFLKLGSTRSFYIARQAKEDTQKTALREGKRSSG